MDDMEVACKSVIHLMKVWVAHLCVMVRTLIHDLLLLFSTDLNYEIYKDDITFVDPLNKFTGIESYTAHLPSITVSRSYPIQRHIVGDFQGLACIEEPNLDRMVPQRNP
ncbi:unnamed protein product [Lactuca virosa]|uniref:Uncharacterized protein n=1 Tax=Lactuca virosa TaxID=75947 RepID=A0AAU9MPD4_9ASTR|nr:unnamed protein product [Lactuca virosa]